MIRLDNIMVGDWVLKGETRPNMGGDYDVIFFPAKITIEDFKFWADNDWNEYDFNEFLKPIDLTEKIIAKNLRFVLETDYYRAYVLDSDHGEMRVEWAKDGNGMKTNFFKITSGFGDIAYYEIEYVHEFQHLLKFCRFKKDIDLKDIELC